MGNLIFVIIIAVIIVNSAKKAQGGSSKAAGSSAKRAAGDGAMGRAGAGTDSTMKDRTKADGAKKTWASQWAQTARGAASRAAQKGRAVSDEPDQELSTTEYLRQKALEDAREHAAEKQQENLRLYRETGGKAPGQRHLEWEDMPRGMKLVRCGYCGAENLIPERDRPQDHTCYFCREDL